MKIVLFSRYDTLGASSRMRSFQYLPFLKSNGIEVIVLPLFGNDYLNTLYKGKRRPLTLIIRAYIKRIIDLLKNRKADLIWIEKELLPFLPYWLEKVLLKKKMYLLDYDDAIFHKYDLHKNSIVRWLFSKKIDKLMNNSRIVICGNSYLEKRAKFAGAKKVEILPTVINTEKYILKNIQETELSVIRIVWIGSPSTESYLNLLKTPLINLAKIIKFKLIIIGANKFKLEGIDIEFIEWNESSEVKDISDCHIGIMPLIDSPWEKGKCGYKLIQYMACGLPIVGSNIGVNSEIIDHGKNGYIANNDNEWVEYLLLLIQSKTKRREMGLNGFLKVEKKYCLKVTAPKLIDHLKEAI